MDFRYIAIEGPIGVGKTVLAQHLGARLNSAVILDETDNPFVGDLYSGRPGAAFQSQLFSVLTRHRQQASLRQTDLFDQLTICDYLFDKDKIYAYLNLDDNELFIYQRLYDLLAADVIAPDLVVYLQTPRMSCASAHGAFDAPAATCRFPTTTTLESSTRRTPTFSTTTTPRRYW